LAASCSAGVTEVVLSLEWLLSRVLFSSMETSSSISWRDHSWNINHVDSCDETIVWFSGYDVTYRTTYDTTPSATQQAFLVLRYEHFPLRGSGLPMEHGTSRIIVWYDIVYWSPLRSSYLWRLRQGAFARWAKLSEVIVWDASHLELELDWLIGKASQHLHSNWIVHLNKWLQMKMKMAGTPYCLRVWTRDTGHGTRDSKEIKVSISGDILSIKVNWWIM
jgi:hypothetical protein